MSIDLNAEVQAFLQRPVFAVLATINPDGMPQQTVVWYEVRGDTLVLNTAAGRLKDRNLRRDPRASVCVTDDGFGVTIRGPVELIDDQRIAQEDIRRLAVRYDGPEAAERQVSNQFSKEHRVSIYMKIEHVVLQGFE
jgi:PPOX class probable F420-dependent enzyme